MTCHLSSLPRAPTAGGGITGGDTGSVRRAACGAAAPRRPPRTRTLATTTTGTCANTDAELAPAPPAAPTPPPPPDAGDHEAGGRLADPTAPGQAASASDQRTPAVARPSAGAGSPPVRTAMTPSIDRPSSTVALVGCYLVALVALAHPGDGSSLALTCSDRAPRPAAAGGGQDGRGLEAADPLRPLPQVPAWCCEDEETGPFGTVLWPKTTVGHFVSVDCPYGPRDDQVPHGRAKAFRRCKLHLSVGPVWLVGDYANCRQFSNDADKAAASASEAEKLTEDPDAITRDAYEQAAGLIQQSYKVALTNRTVARTMLKAMSNLIAAPTAVQRESDPTGAVRQDLVTLLENHGRMVRLEEEETFYEAPLDNLHLRVVRVRPDEDFGPDLEMPFRVRYNGTDDVGPAVRVPLEVLTQVRGNYPAAAGSELRVRFLAIRNAEMLRPPGQRGAPGSQQLVTASVSLASVDPAAGNGTDLDVRNLTTPVRIEMPFGAWGASHVCAYYDMSEGVWKQDGVQLRVDESGTGLGALRSATCASEHLTPFTILLDPNPRRALGDMLVPLTVVGYLGSTLSVLGLVGTIVTYQFFSRFGRDRWGRVLVQLCASLLALHALYLGSNFKGVVSNEGCVGIAVMLHLFLLSSFCWMLVEALLMYQLLIVVFKNSHTKFFLKRLLFAWGTPVVIVVACGAADPRYYLDTHPDFCISSGVNSLQHGLATLMPCYLVTVINFLIFVRVAFVLLKRRRPPGTAQGGGEPPAITWAQVRGVVGVAFLLGVTWLLSPLAMDSPAMALVSSALNASQGLAIFVSRVLTHPEARRSWRSRLRCQWPRSSEFRSSSASYPVSDKISMDASRSSAQGRKRGQETSSSSVEWRRISVESASKTPAPTPTPITPEKGSGGTGAAPDGTRGQLAQGQRGDASAGASQAVVQWPPRPQIPNPAGGRRGEYAFQRPEAAPAHPPPPQKQLICKRRSQLFQQLYVE